MHMTFYWGTRVTILFDSWKTDSWPTYFISLLACFLFSLFYQYMEDRRIRFHQTAAAAAAAAPLLLSKPAGGKWTPSRFAGAILFGVNSAIGYFLMLAIMSFNAGVFIAVVMGLGVGYLLFRGGDDDDVVVVDNPCGCT